MILFRVLPAVLVIGSALLLSACSRPQDASDAPAAADVTQVHLIPPYPSLDKDKDGIVTLAEVDAVAPEWAQRLRACDTDSDQKLSRGEYDACKAANATAH